MMEDKKSFLNKVFNSVAGRKEEEKAVEQLSDVKKADVAEASETEENKRKTLAELSADPKNETIINVLKTIEDPEINIDIWTLELIYDIIHKEEGVEIHMTFTSPMCPFGPQLMQMVKGRIEEQGIKPVDVKITFSPAWKPSEELREMLGV